MQEEQRSIRLKVWATSQLALSPGSPETGSLGVRLHHGSSSCFLVTLEGLAAQVKNCVSSSL